MDPLEYLLGLAERHSSAVIAALLGVILVGSVGGTLWISVLQSQIESTRLTCEERADLAGDRNDHDRRVADAQVQNLRHQIEIVLSGAVPLDPAIAAIEDALIRMREPTSGTPELAEIRSAVVVLKDAQLEMRRSIEEARRMAAMLDSLAAGPSPHPAMSTIGLLAMVVILALAGVASLTWRRSH